MFEQLPRDPGPRAVEVGAGIGTFSARLLDAGVRELLLIEPEGTSTSRCRRTSSSTSPTTTPRWRRWRARSGRWAPDGARPGRLYASLDRAYGHERRYTPQRLRSLVEQAGLTVERLCFFNALGVLGWWARGRTGAREIGRSSLRVYELLLAAWRPIERRVDLPFGLSLIAHARRPD